jgi:hypothetical protein
MTTFSDPYTYSSTSPGAHGAEYGYEYVYGPADAVLRQSLRGPKRVLLRLAV